MAKKVFHTLSNGEEIEVTRETLGGITDSVTYITVDSRVPLGSEEELDTLIHETLHCEFPLYSEEVITNSATFAAEKLWADSWRKGLNGRGSRIKHLEEALHAHLNDALYEYGLECTWVAANSVARLLWKLSWRKHK